VDISDPSALDPLASVFLAPSAIGRLAAGDGYVYLAAGGLGFRIIDVRVPMAPIPGEYVDDVTR
jgi:hypothetical protein